MKANAATICWAVCAVVLGCMAWTSNASEVQDSGDWDIIWQRKMPKPTTVQVGQLGGLGKDLENRTWQMISTGYHQIHFQPSTDTRKVAEIYSLIDNVYKFLEGRSPAKPKTPIKAFLVPSQRGQSRCGKIGNVNVMRTGDKGDALFMLTSLLHEETHLFNVAYLKGWMQEWWSGEFTCIYFQQRALWQAQGKDVKKEIKSRLPDGPRCHLTEIDKRGKQAFDEAFSALYFFEAKYGRAGLNRFRQRCLAEAKKTRGKPLSGSVFAGVFGLDINRLQAEWLQFYGWGSARQEGPSHLLDARLRVKISYSADKASVQNIVQAMANKAGLGYDANKSRSQTSPLCQTWVTNVRITDRPLHEALKQILDPVGLNYKLEKGVIVLHRKQ